MCGCVCASALLQFFVVTLPEVVVVVVTAACLKTRQNFLLSFILMKVSPRRGAGQKGSEGGANWQTTIEKFCLPFCGLRSFWGRLVESLDMS